MQRYRLGRQYVTIQFLYRDWGGWVRLKKKHCIAIQKYSIATEGLDRWARAGAGRAGKGRWGVARAGALQANGRAGRDRGAGARAATLPCRPATRPRGQLRHSHDCCDTTPVRAVRATMHDLGAAWAQDGRAGWVNWAKLVHCAPGSVLTRFLDPV